MLLKIIATAAPSANCDESQHESRNVHRSLSHCAPENTANCKVDAPEILTDFSVEKTLSRINQKFKSLVSYFI